MASSRATLPIVGPLPELVPVQVKVSELVAASSSSFLHAPIIAVIPTIRENKLMHFSYCHHEFNLVIR